jgi:hypothetical protein
MTRSVFCSALTVLFLSSCATSYQKNGFTGGFSETQLSENVFRVNFNGNAYTSGEKAQDFTLLRSAELATEHGYPYFLIVDSKEGAIHSTYTAPTTTTTTMNASYYGNSAYGTAQSTTNGGETYLMSKPTDSNTIVGFKERPSGQNMVYESRFVISSIRSKYGMKPEGQ